MHWQGLGKFPSLASCQLLMFTHSSNWRKITAMLLCKFCNLTFTSQYLKENFDDMRVFYWMTFQLLTIQRLNEITMMLLKFFIDYLLLLNPMTEWNLLRRFVNFVLIYNLLEINPSMGGDYSNRVGWRTGVERGTCAPSSSLTTI